MRAAGRDVKAEDAQKESKKTVSEVVELEDVEALRRAARYKLMVFSNVQVHDLPISPSVAA